LQKLTLILFSLLTCFSLYSQTGSVRGFVYDGESGESLIAVTVAAEGTTNGTYTDLDGSFELNLTPGTYNLEISYVSYSTIKITDVVVKEGEVTLLETINLLSESEVLEQVTITADAIRTSEAALMTIKRKSPNLMDGISSAKFKKIGDSNAGEAVKRVTGVSVESGKYVVVRGLGDRYTKTMLNNVDIPGLDPDKNSLQIDLFPTNLLNNMMVYKTASAELPADFTGGLINIETKDFPEERIFNISFGLTYNPSMHFKDNFLSYEGGSTDWLGFDDGTRALPEQATLETIPSPVSGNSDQEVGNFLSSFNQDLAAQEKTSLPNYSFGLSYGDQKVLKNGHKLGYIMSGTYRSSRDFYENVSYGEYQVQVPSDAYEMIYATTSEGSIGEENTFVGGMVGLAYKTDRSKHKINLIHLQNGESKAAKFKIDNNSDAIGQSGFLAYSDNLEYSQRSITNLLVSGNYSLGNNDWKLDWKISPTISKLTDPDIRKTAFSEFGSNNLGFVAGAGGNPSRIWRYLDETNLVSKFDVTKEYELASRTSKLKFGGSHLYKDRDYNILSYNLQFFGSQPEWTGDPSVVLDTENLYPLGNIYYVSGNNTPNPNQYNSNVSSLAAYVSNEIDVTEKLKATVGLRLEQYVQRHTGRDTEFAISGQSGNNLVNEKVLDAVDLFPSVNLIQSLTEKQNLRFSYAKTIARPSFKELSFAQIIDPITDRIFNGSLFSFTDGSGNVTWDGNLEETRIQNFDLRWELYEKRGQLYSVSAFYKAFDKPIELVRIPQAQTSNEFQPRNVGDGTVMGVELELRKNLPFANEQISFSTNVTLARSTIEMSELEFNSREGIAKDGEVVDNTREMAGQSPFIVNAGLTYNSTELPLDFGLYYNMKGRTLEIVGGGLFPDVYTTPFNSLNFSFNYAFGPDDRVKVGLNADNILGSVRESVYESFQAQDQVFSRFNPGRNFGVSLSYNIF